jgi:CubicO group peptidase (beta-lactamase class C family)
MIRKAFLVVFLISISLVCTTVINAQVTPRTDSTTLIKIEAYLQSLIDTGGVPGITVAITRGQDIVYANAFGVGNVIMEEKLTPRKIFHVASISKTFTATAVMQLVEKGLVGLEEPLVKYLPYFRLADDRCKQITIHQILNHTSGMPDVEDYEWEKAVADAGAAERYTRSLTGKKMVSAPGTEFHYSNMAYDVMADLIAKVSGITFEQYVKENILIPLGMNESSFYYPEIKGTLRTSPHTGIPPTVRQYYPYNRMHAPSSTLNSNVLELSHWAIANMNHGVYKGKQILTPKTHAMMMTPGFIARKDQQISIGLSWFLYKYQGQTIAEHSGGDDGYRSQLMLMPDAGISFVLLSNTDDINMHSVMKKVRDLIIGVTSASN